MPFDLTEFRISPLRLLVALILILIPILLVGVYVGLQASHQQEQMEGAYFRTITRASAAMTSEYVSERVAEVVMIANQPSVQQEVMVANRAYENVPEAAVREKADQLENKWNTPDSDALAKKILSSPAAEAIRLHHELNPKLLRVMVVDQAGAAVAATDKPLHYFQTESEFWRAFASNAKPAVQVSEVRFDEQSRAPYVSISAPIFQQGSGRFIGAVTALVDLSPLFGYLTQQQIAQTGRVFLVDDSGTVVTSSGLTPGGRLKSDEYNAIRDALGTLHGREAGYIVATLPNGGNYLVGFADTGLKAAYPNLGWIVVASQETREAEGAVRTMTHFAMLLLIAGLVLVSILGAYVYDHRKQEMEEIEPKEEKQNKDDEEHKRAMSA